MERGGVETVALSGGFYCRNLYLREVGWRYVFTREFPKGQQYHFYASGPGLPVAPTVVTSGKYGANKTDYAAAIDEWSQKWSNTGVRYRMRRICLRSTMSGVSYGSMRWRRTL